MPLILPCIWRFLPIADAHARRAPQARDEMSGKKSLTQFSPELTVRAFYSRQLQESYPYSEGG
jgi:hypothetical protein